MMKQLKTVKFSSKLDVHLYTTKDAKRIWRILVSYNFELQKKKEMKRKFTLMKVHVT